MTTADPLLSDAEVAGYRPAATWAGQPVGGGRLHAELQLSLARFLADAGYLTFTEVQINRHGGGGGLRADVVALKPSYASLDVRIYECKATRQDLNRGLNRDPKWRLYREYAHRVIFAMPAGLAKTEEIPSECGIATRGPNGWHHVRPGIGHTPPRLDHWLILALLFRGYEDHRRARDLRQRMAHTARDGALDYKALATYAGHDLARRLAKSEHQLDPGLRRLKEECEAVFGKPLNQPFEVANLASRLALLRETLEDCEAHTAALGKIGHYLGSIGSHWTKQRDKIRNEAVRGLP